MMAHRYPRRVSLAALVGDSLAPGRPTWSSLFGDWSLDPLFVVTVLVGALYVTGVRRLAHRGRQGPARRSVCFGIGLFLVVFVTQSGLAAYDRVLFSLHVVQHLTLGMVAPVFLVL